MGLTFLGETREDEHLVVGDIHVKGLSTAVSCQLENRLVLSLITSFLYRRIGTAGVIGEANCTIHITNYLYKLDNWSEIDRKGYSFDLAKSLSPAHFKS